MRLLLICDPTSPNGEDAFCREVSARAAGRGHTAKMQIGQRAARADAELPG